MQARDGRDCVVNRDFSVLCFNWDGTAVPDRRADVTALRSLIERLCALGVDVAIFSGTSVSNVDGQLLARPAAEGHLFLFLSRGSEVYVVGPAGPRLLERRVATPDENARLDASVEALRARLTEAGLDTEVVYDRLNRRKIDLAPEARLSDVVRLQHDVQRRLEAAGLAGFDEVIALAKRCVEEAGLPHSGVTTDAKHIEIGLTDKGHSMRRLSRLLLKLRGRSPHDALIIGDQFGPIGAGEGGDALTLVPELAGATFVSVGVEPNGVPPQVAHFGGGPQRLRRILSDQLTRRLAVASNSFPEPIDDPAWRFEVKGFDPFREREVETWLTVANGETGTRGAVEEGSAVSTPATFVAGVFGDGTGDPSFRQPVLAPDWTGLRLTAWGSPVTLSSGEILRHERVLDMRHGVVYRYWRQRLSGGQTVRVRTARFASLADRQVMAIRAEAMPEDAPARMVWTGAMGVSHAGGATKEIEVELLDEPGVLTRTRGRNGGGHALVASTRPAPGSPIARHLDQDRRDVIGGRLEAGDLATVDRIAAVVSARTRVPSAESARKVLAWAEGVGYDELFRRHCDAWEERWRDADLAVEGDPVGQEALRFSIFHMIATAHPTKDTVSVGARGLGGLSYFLHVFWDTEIFVLPFFIWTHPQTARTLLAYRYRNLDGARKKARSVGCRGALFPWESADRGTEVTPEYVYSPDGEKISILSGLIEHHISADVAWGVWEYWKCTADDEFMVSMGVEIMLETARFWASRSSLDDEGRYHITMVVGPDEYHEEIDDNAFTNVLARWNIRKAVEALEWLRGVDRERAQELYERLALSGVEIEAWLEVADNLVDDFDPETKLFEQFAGFYEMEDVPVERLRPRPMAADVVLGRAVTLRSKVVKQADIVMLCHILSDEYGDDVASANYDYYEPMTCHGSSLSPGIHAAVAARLGRLDDAVSDFEMAVAIDLGDNMGNAARGPHLAAMGGLWQAAFMGFLGLQRRDEALLIDPHLPPAWTSASVPLLFRGSRAEFAFAQVEDGVEVGITVEDAPLTVLLGSEERVLAPGRFLLRRTNGRDWEVMAL